MRNLKAAGIISISQGMTGIHLSKNPRDITFYDIFSAVELSDGEQLFHFHQNPNKECPVGGNIHRALDTKLDRIQLAMENEMRHIKLSDVIEDIIASK